MEELIVLLYGECGILHRIEIGDEDRVVSAEKEWLLNLAKETNRRNVNRRRADDLYRCFRCAFILPICGLD